MSINQSSFFEYFIQKVVHINRTETVAIERNLHKVVDFFKENPADVKSKQEMFKENQWFPYFRVVAYKPSGKIKVLNFNTQLLN